MKYSEKKYDNKIKKENKKMKPDTPEAYSEPCQTSKMELFVKMING